MEGFDQSLHIVESSAPAGTLKFALRLQREQVLVNEDGLSYGPAPAAADLNDWRARRESVMRAMYMSANWPEFSFAEFADDGLLMNAQRLRHDRSVVVWVGVGLQDQLFLAWVVFLFDQVKADLSNLHVVQFECLGPEQLVLSIGELSPENIREQCPAPRRLELQKIEELRRVWRVYTDTNPSALASYLSGTTSLPIIQKAVGSLVLRYPDIRSGLNESDERLLRNAVDKGPSAVRVVGYSMAYNDSLDNLGDVYLFNRLMRMANMRSPLVSLTGDVRSMRECQVTVTALGRKVLAGEANNYHDNGLDDWIGGVHLSKETQIVFRQGNSLLIK